MNLTNSWLNYNEAKANLNVASYYNLLLVSEDRAEHVYMYRLCGIMQHIDNSTSMKVCSNNPPGYYSLDINTQGFSQNSKQIFTEESSTKD